MITRADSHLYRALKNRICEQIYRGIYADGENLPPERLIAERFGMSRVTVRKALSLLEGEGVIERVQGSGNRVRLALEGHQGEPEIIAVLAQAQNAFFASFIDHFQRTAEKSDSLVLFKQNPLGEKLEDTLFRLHQKAIRNAVIWLEHLTVDLELIRRLRGLGMNMVFFDVVPASPYADGVLLDNAAAVRALCADVQARGATQVAYLGWESSTISAVREREAAFRRCMPEAPVIRIAWAEKGALIGRVATWVEELRPPSRRRSARTEPAELPHAVVCGDGEIGVAVRKCMNAAGLGSVLVASPDDFPEARSLSMHVYRQDFERLAEQTYQCILRQNRPAWAAATYRVPGQMVVYK